jgi:hypothetical protein
MTITESRVRNGTLTFGTATAGDTTFACQATNVHVTPSYDSDGDAVTTLCGDELPEGKKESYVIGGTSIQDFDDPAGFLAYCYDNAMQTVDFSWEPNEDGAPTWAGQCVIVALEEGGDVNTRLTTDWEFDIVGRPTRTPGTAGAAAQQSAPADQPEQPAA